MDTCVQLSEPTFSDLQLLPCDPDGTATVTSEFLAAGKSYVVYGLSIHATVPRGGSSIKRSTLEDGASRTVSDIHWAGSVIDPLLVSGYDAVLRIEGSSELSRLDLSSFEHKSVALLPDAYDGNVIFELPPASLEDLSKKGGAAEWNGSIERLLVVDEVHYNVCSNWGEEHAAVVKETIHSSPHCTPSQIRAAVSNQIFLRMLDGLGADGLTREENYDLLDSLSPVAAPETFTNLIRSIRKSSKEPREESDIITLQQRINFRFVHRSLFVGQAGPDQRVHVFKMTVDGSGFGLDLLRRMLPGGTFTVHGKHRWFSAFRTTRTNHLPATVPVPATVPIPATIPDELPEHVITTISTSTDNSMPVEGADFVFDSQQPEQTFPAPTYDAGPAGSASSQSDVQIMNVTFRDRHTPEPDTEPDVVITGQTFRARPPTRGTPIPGRTHSVNPPIVSQHGIPVIEQECDKRFWHLSRINISGNPACNGNLVGPNAPRDLCKTKIKSSGHIPAPLTKSAEGWSNWGMAPVAPSFCGFRHFQGVDMPHQSGFVPTYNVSDPRVLWLANSKCLVYLKSYQFLWGPISRKPKLISFQALGFF
ncbi:hypothetical protein R1sor_008799 [Riccia sorocarpa]|uniref:Uncharacterized protein n=1 Tax=Riccia sorocarpa TaxID=122646 RepID=A0ABD3HUI1_9MARC